MSQPDREHPPIRLPLPNGHYIVVDFIAGKIYVHPTGLPWWR